jgi:hypothetical protein
MALKDKAGVGVNIGDSVTEADFSFGDGVVKSITVPCSDGSHNVGLKWDDPRVESADLIGERRQTGRQASLRDRGGARRRETASQRVCTVEMLPKVELFPLYRRWNMDEDEGMCDAYDAVVTAQA